MRLQLLRAFSLRRDGLPVDVLPSSQRLVAFLALQDRKVDRLVVSGTLWIDFSEARAGASLRTALWRLGQAAAGLVIADGPTLRLDPGVAIDVRHAGRRADLLIRMPEEHCDRDVELLGAAGELLPDWYDDWILFERERFRQLRLHALDSLCRAHTAAGAFAQAILTGLAAVALEPLRESSHRALISAYIAEGNPSEAVRHYGLYKRHLAGALGLDPTPRMEMLMGRVPGVALM